MIFYFNADGTPKAVLPESIARGSSKANDLYFVCPTSENNVVNVAFKIPNGTVTEKFIMKFEKDSLNGVFDENGVNFNVWHIKIPTVITACGGIVGVQFYISCEQETLATFVSSFTVSEGFIAETPTEGDDYNQITEFLSATNNRIENLEKQSAYLHKLTFLISSGEVVETYQNFAHITLSTSKKTELSWNYFTQNKDIFKNQLLIRTKSGKFDSFFYCVGTELTGATFNEIQLNGYDVSGNVGTIKIIASQDDIITV